MGKINLCQSWINDIYEKYYLTNKNGEQLGEGIYIGKEVMPMSEKDEILIDFLKGFSIIVVPVYTALCILATTMIFYQRKIKKPLLILQNAAFAHDLRTPLTVIKGYSEILQTGNAPELRNTADTNVYG